LVPSAIIKGEKRGFSMPLAAWLREELKPLVRDVLSPQNLSRQGFFSPQVARQLIDEHWSGQTDHHRKIWALLVFSLWFDRYAVGPRPS
jgi:asparagine synthase (glutamine-hydrolysing)